MKRLLPALLLLQAFSTAFAQDARFFVSIGPSVAFGKFAAPNYVIDRYNETRQGQPGAATLTRDMRNLHAYTGIGWRAGVYKFYQEAGIYFGISRTGRRASTYATGIDSLGGTQRRDLIFTANSTGLEAGIGLGNPDEGGAFILGLKGDFIKYKAYTRVGSADYQKVYDELTVGLTPFMELNMFFTKRVGAGLRMGYNWVPAVTDYTALSKALNPNTFAKDNPDKLISRGSNFTAQLWLSLALGGS